MTNTFSIECWSIAAVVATVSSSVFTLTATFHVIWNKRSDLQSYLVSAPLHFVERRIDRLQNIHTDFDFRFSISIKHALKWRRKFTTTSIQIDFYTSFIMVVNFFFFFAYTNLSHWIAAAIQIRYTNCEHLQFFYTSLKMWNKCIPHATSSICNSHLLASGIISHAMR